MSFHPVKVSHVHFSPARMSFAYVFRHVHGLPRGRAGRFRAQIEDVCVCPTAFRMRAFSLIRRSTGHFPSCTECVVPLSVQTSCM